MWLTLLLLLSILLIILLTTRLQVHAFLALLLSGILFGLFAGIPLADIVVAIEEGFGGTIGKIGVVIVAGTIIGTFLERSGGAYALAERILKVIGQKHVPLAMSIIGYIVSIPVFADSGFVILAPLNRALSRRAGITLAASAIALALGLMASHTMMPPTPGPIAAAGILEADLGLVILVGLPVSILAMLLGWLWAVKVASRVDIDPAPDLTEQDLSERLAAAPPATKAFLPILVPIFLIVLKSIAEYPSHPFGTGVVVSLLSFVGAPIIALLLGVVIAITLPKKFEAKMLSVNGWAGDGLLAAAIIIMITGAGGAFGKVLQKSGIAEIIGSGMSGVNMGLWLPFLVAAAIRAAQGSATVAIITTASVLAPLTGALGLDSALARALMVISIGAGSLAASHVNDSFFWVVTQMSGMDVRTGFRLQTLGSIIMAVAAAFFVWLIGVVVL
jgi:GntP family gluconate:H+ symporter